MSAPPTLIVGRATAAKLSPKASLTAAASHEPEKSAFTEPSLRPAIPAPSASFTKFGLAAKSTKYCVTCSAFSPEKSIPAASSVPSPYNVHPLATKNDAIYQEFVHGKEILSFANIASRLLASSSVKADLS